jgi:hypothetical protein
MLKFTPILNTNEIIKYLQKYPFCFEVQKILTSGWISTFFIEHKRTYHNHKITFTMTDSCNQTYTITNFELLEFYKNTFWRVRIDTHFFNFNMPN